MFYKRELQNMDTFNALLYATFILCGWSVCMTIFVIYMGEREERQKRKSQNGAK